MKRAAVIITLLILAPGFIFGLKLLASCTEV
jgi:hypothetical protein